MKKRSRFFALILAASLSLSFNACGKADADKGNVEDAGTSGSESGQDEEEVDALAAAQENMKNVKSMNACTSMDMDMEMTAAGETQSMQMTTTVDMTCFYDPVRMKIDTTAKSGEEAATISMYGEENEDGTFTLYMNDGTGWQSQEIQAADMKQYDAAASMNEYLGDDLVLDGKEQLNGADAYKYTGVLTGDAMKEVMAASAAQSLTSLGVDSAQLESMMDGLSDIPITFWIDAESFYPVKYELDMLDTMNGLMTKILESFGEQAEGLSMSISNMRVEMTCDSYNEAEEFSIPDEAKQA